MKRVLDTNVFSALMRGEAGAVERLSRAARSDVFVPQPVLAEIAYGLERLPRSKRRESLRARFELLRGELRRADWTDEVSEAFGRVKAALEKRGERIEDFDVAMAAHAVALRAVLVTANVKHMARVAGIEVEYWSGEG